MRILVIRFKLMGDAILSSSICHSLRLSFPDSIIDYVTYAPYHELFEKCDAIDNVFGLDYKTRKSPIRYLRFVLEITNRDYDIVIDAQGTAKSNIFSLLAKTAQYRISSARRRFSLSFTHQVAKPALKDKLDERLSLLSPLKERFNLILTRSFRLGLEKSEIEKAKFKLNRMGVDLQRPVFVFAISANETFKKWCRLEYLEIVHYCRLKYGAQVLLYYGLPHEREDVRLFVSELADNSNVFLDYEIDSLRCLPALFSVCDLFIGNEGGPRHVAHAVGTPTVSIFSPHASKDEWLPRGDGSHLGIEWLDIEGHGFDENQDFETGDSAYFKRYNSIKADMVKPLIDQVLRETGYLVCEASKQQTRLYG